MSQCMVRCVSTAPPRLQSNYETMKLWNYETGSPEFEKTISECHVRCSFALIPFISNGDFLKSCPDVYTWQSRVSVVSFYGKYLAFLCIFPPIIHWFSFFFILFLFLLFPFFSCCHCFYRAMNESLTRWCAYTRIFHWHQLTEPLFC